jgi:TonB family protein
VRNDFRHAIGASLLVHGLAVIVFWGTWELAPSVNSAVDVEWTWSAPAPEKALHGQEFSKAITGQDVEKQGTDSPPPQPIVPKPGLENEKSQQTISPSSKATEKEPVASGPAQSPSFDAASTGYALVPPRIKERPPLQSQGLPGNVLLSVEILENGRVGKIIVSRTSGSKLLDEAARDNVSRWSFEPARQAQGQKPVTVVTAIWVRF